MHTDLSLSTLFDLPRLAGGPLCHPDGRRLIVAVQSHTEDGPTSSLWEVDTDPVDPEPRLADWAVPEDALGVYLSDGSVAFSSTRADEAGGEESEQPTIWVRPADGRPPRPVLTAPGGVLSMAAAGRRRALVARVAVHRGVTLAQDGEKERRRKAAGTSGLLFEEYPVRWWDQPLGPRTPRLVHVDLEAQQPRVRDLTGDVGGALHDVYGGALALSSDGRTTVTNWRRPQGRGFGSYDLVAVDDSGVRTLADGGDFFLPALSPDDQWVVAVRRSVGSAGRAESWTLWLTDLDEGGGRDLLPDFDLWPCWPVWAPDGSAIYFTADERGRVPVFRLVLGTGDVERVADGASYAGLAPHPDGSRLFALRSSMAEPPCLVEIPLGSDATRTLWEPTKVTLPGTLEETETVTDDGAVVRSWLVLPEGCSERRPAPLVTLIHGGPIGSWNGWSWRWNPYLLAAEGYAVLLPDPAQSTGYGQAFIQRGWGDWGDRPYRDVLAAVESAAGRDDVDESKLAAMGSSFGGYLVNWIAGHDDRFGALVPVSGIWALDQQHGASDSWVWSEHEFGDPYADPTRLLASSPHRAIGAVRTPMLVVHGERDYRVPIDQALRLWTDLQRHEVPSRLLTFPDEGHFIGGPGNVRVLYQTVLAFLAEHLHGAPWDRPPDL